MSDLHLFFNVLKHSSSAPLSRFQLNSGFDKSKSNSSTITPFTLNPSEFKHATFSSSSSSANANAISEHIVVTDRSIRVVVMVRTTKKNYLTKVVCLHKTWLSKVPDWVRVEFYSTIYDDVVPSSNYSTVLVQTQEALGKGNQLFLRALKELHRKYIYVQAFFRVEDHTFVNWHGLQFMLERKKMWNQTMMMMTTSSDAAVISNDTSIMTSSSSLLNGTNNASSSSSSSIYPMMFIDRNQSIIDLRNNTFRYLGNCNCVIKHDKKGNYCKDKKECAVLDNIPDFNYVCGGSGVLMNR